MPTAFARTRATEEVPVSFEIECDDFAVPEWSGLRCSATFEVAGYVEIDHSGDSITPDGPPSASVMLLEPKAYTISLVNDELDVALPEWMQQRLALDDADYFDAAFLAAIGGQDKLNERAIEIALGL